MAGGEAAPLIDDRTDVQKAEDETGEYTVGRIVDYELQLAHQEPDTYDPTLGEEVWRVSFYTKWLNWPDSKNTWEPKSSFAWNSENDRWIAEIRAQDPKKKSLRKLEQEANELNEQSRQRIAAAEAQKAIKRKRKKLNSRSVARAASTTSIGSTTSDVAGKPKAKARETRTSQLDSHAAGIADFLESENAPASVRQLRYEIPRADRSELENGPPGSIRLVWSGDHDRTSTDDRTRVKDVKPDLAQKSSADQRNNQSQGTRAVTTAVTRAVPAEDDSLTHLPHASGEGGFADSDDDDVDIDQGFPLNAVNSTANAQPDSGAVEKRTALASREGPRSEDLGFADSDDEEPDHAQSAQDAPSAVAQIYGKQMDGNSAATSPRRGSDGNPTGPADSRGAALSRQTTSKDGPAFAEPDGNTDQAQHGLVANATATADYEKPLNGTRQLNLSHVPHSHRAVSSVDFHSASPPQSPFFMDANSADSLPELSARKASRSERLQERRSLDRSESSPDQSHTSSANTTILKGRAASHSGFPPPQPTIVATAVEKRKRSNDIDSTDSSEPSAKIPKSSSASATISKSATSNGKSTGSKPLKHQNGIISHRDVSPEHPNDSSSKEAAAAAPASTANQGPVETAPPVKRSAPSSGLGRIKRVSKDQVVSISTPSLDAAIRRAAQGSVTDEEPRLPPAPVAPLPKPPLPQMQPSPAPDAIPAIKAVPPGQSSSLAPAQPSRASAPAPTRDPRRRPSADPSPAPPGPFTNGSIELLSGSDKDASNRRRSKDGFIVLDAAALEIRVKATGFLKRKAMPAESNKSIASRIREYWKVGQPRSLFLFDHILTRGPSNRPRECFIFAPQAKEQSTSKKSREAHEDCIAMQLILASIEGVKLADSLRSTCEAVFVHVSEQENLCRWPNEKPSELEQLRSRAIGTTIFVLFGDREDAVGLISASNSLTVPRDTKMRELWNTTAAVTFTPEAWQSAPEHCLKLAGKCKRSTRSWKRDRDVFCWAHVSLILASSKFSLLGDPDAATWFFHQALRESSISLTATTPNHQFGPHFDHKFPTGDDQQLYTAEDIERVARWFPTSGFVTSLSAMQELSALYKSRYLNIRRWIVVGTADQVQQAQNVPGVDVLTLDKAETEIFRPIFRAQSGWG